MKKVHICVCVLVCAVVIAVFSSPVNAQNTHYKKNEISDMIQGAIASAEMASREVSEGSLRLAGTSINILEKDVRLLGKSLPLEKVYSLLQDAEVFIGKNAMAHANNSLDDALREVNKMKGYSSDTMEKLRAYINQAQQDIAKGSSETAKKSISAAKDLINNTGTHVNYQKTQEHIVKAKRAVVDGSADVALAEIANIHKGLDGLYNNIEASKIRIGLQNAIYYVQKGAVIPAQSELKIVLNGLFNISSKAGDNGAGALDSVTEAVKNVSTDITSGVSKTKDESVEKLNNAFINVEAFLD
ncbi:MAG: hypothetical protein P9M13_00900 [Candidatus Ancaeobacter aquaticus]|nr:hypothetical protein [Candidatus Ancaeobacter aquaticus]